MSNQLYKDIENYNNFEMRLNRLRISDCKDYKNFLLKINKLCKEYINIIEDEHYKNRVIIVLSCNFKFIKDYNSDKRTDEKVNKIKLKWNARKERRTINEVVKVEEVNHSSVSRRRL